MFSSCFRKYYQWEYLSPHDFKITLILEDHADTEETLSCLQGQAEPPVLCLAGMLSSWSSHFEGLRKSSLLKAKGQKSVIQGLCFFFWVSQLVWGVLIERGVGIYWHSIGMLASPFFFKCIPQQSTLFLIHLNNWQSVQPLAEGGRLFISSLCQWRQKRGTDEIRSRSTLFCNLSGGISDFPPLKLVFLVVEH